MSIKKYVSTAIATSIVLSVAFGSFAAEAVAPVPPAPLAKPLPAPAPVIEVESEIDRLTKEFNEEVALIVIAARNEIAEIRAGLDELRQEIKAAQEAEEVDEEALAALLEEEEAIKADLKVKEDALRIFIEKFKLEAEFGAEVTAEILAAKDEIAVIREKHDAIKKEVIALQEAEEVDEEALAALLAEEEAIHVELKAKEEALRLFIDTLRLEAEFGAENAAKIIEARGEIAVVRESLDALRKEIKAAQEAEEVDEEALAALLAEEETIKADLKAKEDALRAFEEKLRLEAKYGVENAAKIIAAKGEVAVAREKVDAIKKEIKAAKEAEEVDEEALAALLETEKALKADLKAKEDALRAIEEKIKLEDEFGAEIAAEILAAKDEIAAIRSELDALRQEIKAAREAEEVDEEALAALVEAEKALHEEQHAKEKALDEYIKSLRAPAEEVEEPAEEVEEVEDAE